MASKSKKAKALTKSQLADKIATHSGLSKAQCMEVFTALTSVIGAELKAGRPVTISGLIKITLQHKAATPARQGKNPFTGEAMMIKAKPARKVVRVRPLKALKDMA